MAPVPFPPILQTLHLIVSSMCRFGFAEGCLMRLQALCALCRHGEAHPPNDLPPKRFFKTPAWPATDEMDSSKSADRGDVVPSLL